MHSVSSGQQSLSIFGVDDVAGLEGIKRLSIFLSSRL